MSSREIIIENMRFCMIPILITRADAVFIMIDVYVMDVN